MFTFRPFTWKWPWRTSCRASFRVSAKPRRNTTLSRRSSSVWRRFSPVLPFAAAASWYAWRNPASRRPYIRFTFCFSRSWTPYSENLVLPWPCWPGGYGRRSMAHLSV